MIIIDCIGADLQRRCVICNAILVFYNTIKGNCGNKTFVSVVNPNVSIIMVESLRVIWK